MLVPSPDPPAATIPRPALAHVGRERSPVLTVDAVGDLAAGRAAAGALAPFPRAHGNYPGVRRMIDERDAGAFSYVRALLEAATPYLAGAFDLDAFELTEASFSLVTTPPDALVPVQRAPHFDGPHPGIYAILHYLAPCAGTAFFRHRDTGIERVTERNLDTYVDAAKATPAPAGYVTGDTPHFERIGHVAGEAGRLVAYPAGLLHSGVIPPDFVPSADPLRGRLTANLFIRAR